MERRAGRALERRNVLVSIVLGVMLCWKLVACVGNVYRDKTTLGTEVEEEKREKVSERKDEKLAISSARENEQLKRKEEEVENQGNDK